MPDFINTEHCVEKLFLFQAHPFFGHNFCD